MRKRVLILASTLLLAAGLFLRAETDDEVEARKQVLDLTGAFQNEGFKLRDGHWAGQLKPMLVKFAMSPLSEALRDARH